MDYQFGYLRVLLLVVIIPRIYCKGQIVHNTTILSSSDKLPGHISYYSSPNDLMNSNSSTYQVPWEIVLKHLTFIVLTNIRDNINSDISHYPGYKRFLKSQYIRSYEYLPQTGDIITLARGRVEKLKNGNYRFMEGQCANKCDTENIDIVAFWIVQKIRHQDKYQNVRYETKLSIKLNIHNRNDIKREIRNGVIRTFILKDNAYQKTFQDLSEYSAQRRLSEGRKIRFNDIFPPNHRDKDTFISQYQRAFVPQSPDLNIGEYIPNLTIDRNTQRIGQPQMKFPIPTTFHPKYNTKYFQLPVPDSSRKYQNHQISQPMASHYNSIGLEAPAPTTHLHHHYYLTRNKFPDDKPKQFYSDGILTSQNFSHDFRTNIKNIEDPSKIHYNNRVNTPSPITNQIPNPPNLSTHIQINHGAYSLPMTAPILPPPPLIFMPSPPEIPLQIMHTMPVAHHVSSFMYSEPEPPQYSQYANRYPGPTKPFVGSPKYNSIRYSEPVNPSSNSFFEQEGTKYKNYQYSEPESPKHSNIRYSDPDPLYVNNNLNPEENSVNEDKEENHKIYSDEILTTNAPNYVDEFFQQSNHENHPDEVVTPQTNYEQQVEYETPQPNYADDQESEQNSHQNYTDRAKYEGPDPNYSQKNIEKHKKSNYNYVQQIKYEPSPTTYPQQIKNVEISPQNYGHKYETTYQNYPKQTEGEKKLLPKKEIYQNHKHDTTADEYKKPDSINSQLPLPDREQDVRVPYVDITHTKDMIRHPVFAVTQQTPLLSSSSTLRNEVLKRPDIQIIPSSTKNAPITSKNLTQNPSRKKSVSQKRGHSYYKSTTEMPVLKWMPKRTKLRRVTASTIKPATIAVYNHNYEYELPPSSSTISTVLSNSIFEFERIPVKKAQPLLTTTRPPKHSKPIENPGKQLAKYEFEQIPFNITEGIITSPFPTKSTEVPTKQSISTSISIKVGTEMEEKPFVPTITIPNVELYEANLEKVNVNSSDIKLFKATEHKEETNAEEVELTKSIVNHVRTLDSKIKSEKN